MQKLDRAFLEKEYLNTKKEGINYFNKKQYKQAISYFEFAAQIAWLYPILDSFVDDELEFYLKEITTLNFDKIINKSIAKRIVFYNGQIIDFGALTEQYLDYFISNGYDVLFIVPDIQHTRAGNNILKKIGAANNAELFIPNGKSRIEKIEQIRNKINSFCPEKAFLHFLPNDVIGFCSFSEIENLIRLYIVHNDHTFWIGKGCSDYFLEFRGFGIKLATEKRNIPINKIKYLPYYPIKSEIPFQGFPFNRIGKIVGVSGGVIYKYILDKELKYFHLIKELLIENPSFIFCLCGQGYEDIIDNFILENNLQSRFYFLGKRFDFSSLVKNCDLLFESYPLKGGLTPLFAIEENIPVIGIANFNNASGSLEDLIGISDYKQPTTFTDFKKEATLLIKSKEQREKLTLIQKDNPFNQKCFRGKLDIILNNIENIDKLPLYQPKLNMDYYLNEYLQLPGAVVEIFYLTKLSSLKSVLSIKEKVYLLFNCRRYKLTKKQTLRAIANIFNINI